MPFQGLFEDCFRGYLGAISEVFECCFRGYFRGYLSAVSEIFEQCFMGFEVVFRTFLAHFSKRENIFDLGFLKDFR